MSDTYTLGFQNFRSLKDTSVEVAPLTVVYGPNGSGKSSLIYGLLTLRNFLTNPNQNMASLFSYPSISLGGYHEVVHRHATNQDMLLSVGTLNPSELSSSFAMTLSESGAEVGILFEEQSIGADDRIWSWPSIANLEISVPYQGNQRVDNFFLSCRPLILPAKK